MSRIVSLIKGKCPNCEQGDVFQDKGNIFLLRFPVMRKKCEVCGDTFEKEPGYYWGAMYFSYGLALAEGIMVYLLSQIFLQDPFDYRGLLLALVVIVLLSLVNFRYARLMWMYIFTAKKA
jgi:uncharacterized protein (DUF983 family)